MKMSKTLANPMLFAAAAVLFAVASFANNSGVVSTSLVMNPDRETAPIEMRSGGSLPPDPFEDPPNVIAKNMTAKK
jgi:hypothetical protein